MGSFDLLLCLFSFLPCLYTLSLPPLPTLLSLPSPQSNQTLPNNATNSLPADPFYEIISQGATPTPPFLRLKIYNYGSAVSAADVIHAIFIAEMDCEAHSSLETLMGPRERHYDVSEANMLLLPGATMTWQLWSNALEGLTKFFLRFDFVELYFDIEDLEGQSARLVGSGTITR